MGMSSICRPWTLLLALPLLAVSLSCKPRPAQHGATSAPPEPGDAAPTVARGPRMTAGLDDWIAVTRKLPPKKRVDETARRLVQHNPGFDGFLEPNIDFAGITWLSMTTDQVADLTPLQGLNPLLGLRAAGSSPGRGKVTDLKPLQGLPLEGLELDNNAVSDLSPLRGMKLTRFSAVSTQVTDLTPLRDMPLSVLSLWHSPVKDLSPLRGVPLESLDIRDTQVTDLMPLKGMSLKKLWLDFNPQRDAALVKNLWALEQVNGDPLVSFWRQHDPAHAAFCQWIVDTRKSPVEKQAEAVEKKFKERNPGFNIAVLPRIENGIVTEFAVSHAAVVDLAALQGLPRLRMVDCSGCPNLTDIAAVGGLPLKYLTAERTKIVDLTPLRGMKLETLGISDTRVADLSPIRGMPLQQFLARNIPAADLSPIKDMPLRVLAWSFQKDRDTAVLRSLKRLETVNDKPVAEFWKEAEGR